MEIDRQILIATECDCGKIVQVCRDCLNNGRVKSCGCKDLKGIYLVVEKINELYKDDDSIFLEVEEAGDFYKLYFHEFAYTDTDPLIATKKQIDSMNKYEQFAYVYQAILDRK